MDMNGQGPELAEILEEMDIQGLKEFRRKIDRAIAGYETRKRREALSAVEQTAKEHGFKLAELLEERKSGQGRKSIGGPAKYVNPEDPEQTWSGRGRRPQWVNDALEAGRTLDEMAA